MSSPDKQYLLDNFEAAIRQQYIQVYYQPVIRTITREACSFEALARWLDPVHGMIRPDQFIELLEAHRLIHLLDTHVIREVCSRLRTTIDEGYYPIPVSINLSRLDFVLCDIFSVVDETVREFRIPPNLLYIEITESLFSQNEKEMQAVIERFRSAGYQVWIDDFGSGYSSLNALKDYNCDLLKADMHFLSTFHLRSRKILTSIVGMAKDIGIHTLVEGVETEDQFRFLRDIACEKVQGYLFGRPAPYDDTLDHLRATGVKIERSRERRYYDELGAVNVLSAAPFMSDEERNGLKNALQLNSIPLALAEVRGERCFRPLYFNAAFMQAVGDTHWGENVFRRELLGTLCSTDLIPRRSLNTIEESRSTGDSKQFFISNGEYYELRSKCVTQVEDAFCVMLRLENLSRNADFSRLNTLDTGLRHIYSLFDRVALFDLENDSFSPVYVGPNDEDRPTEPTSSMIARYCAENIFAEDRPAFRRFYDLSDLDARIAGSGNNYISAFFRTLDRHGQYSWKQYFLVRLRIGSVFSIIRDAEADVHAVRQLLPSPPMRENAAVPGEGQLWKSLMQSGFPRIYWKDAQRRYLGASPGFLEYFGLSSPDGLIGRTDEEIRWHILEEHTTNQELRVLHEGALIRDALTTFLVGGVSRTVLCSSAPVYDDSGKITGLVGWLRDPSADDAPAENAEAGTRDELTGLLNARGLHEELDLFCDMYYLRRIDFVRIHISVEDFNSIVMQYGYPFGDKVIAALGKALSRQFGTDAVLGRPSGYQFVILRQLRQLEEIPRLLEEIRKVAAQLGEVDGIPCSLYLSFGTCAFSECEDPSKQAQRADTRRLADQNEHTAFKDRLSRSGVLFQMYDQLPLSFAVYHLKTDPETGELQAEFFYVNNRFAHEQNKTPDQIIGRSTKEVFPTLEQEWYDMAQRAAFLSEEVVAENVYIDCMKTHYYVTASQIIRPGYCVFTYQPLDGPFATLP